MSSRTIYDFNRVFIMKTLAMCALQRWSLRMFMIEDSQTSNKIMTNGYKLFREVWDIAVRQS